MQASQPKAVLVGGVGVAVGAGMSQAAPSAAPPKGAGRVAASAGAAGAAGGAGTTWSQNQTINALWSINEDRNSWVGVAGIGWVKLSNASDSGIVALTVLGAHAKQLQTIVNYRQEDDGMIHEIYAW
jgi:hypothetical protein